MASINWSSCYLYLGCMFLSLLSVQNSLFLFPANFTGLYNWPDSVDIWRAPCYWGSCIGQGTVQVAVNVTEQKVFIHPELAETNTRHQELQWRKTGYFVMNGATQENGKLMFKSPNSPVVGVADCIGQDHKTPWVWGFGFVLGAYWSELRHWVISSGLENSSEVCLVSLFLVSWESLRVIILP